MKLSRTSVGLLFSLTLVTLLSLAQVRQRPPRREPTPPRTSRPAVILSAELAAAVNELLKQEPLAPESATTAITEEPDAGEKPPAEDAPLAALLAYWQQPRYGEGVPEPSEKVRQRLLEAIEARPWLIHKLFIHLPEDEEAAERLYRVYQHTPDEDDRWKTGLRDWLTYHSRYFLDDLFQLVQQTRNNADGGADAFALDALARLDWERAKPLLLARQTEPEHVAVLYKNARRVNDTALNDSSRQRLQAIVADPSTGEQRLFALHALFEDAWEGQAEWFAKLFADASLTGIKLKDNQERRSGSHTNNDAPAASSAEEPVEHTENYLAVVLARYAKRLLPSVCKLVDALVQFLSSAPSGSEQSVEAARALLPWLTDPAWAEVRQRETFIGALSQMELPESAPGMLWVLSNDEDDTLRALAAETLGNLKYQAAAPAIRRALEREKDEALRPRLVVALMQCGGITDEEAAAAIEAFARRLVTPTGAAQINAIRDGQDAEPLPLQISIGRILSDDETLPCPEGLAVRLFARVKALRKTQPQVAKEMLNIVQGVPLPVAYQFLAQRIGEGWVDVEALKLALESTAELRQHASSGLYPLLEHGGYPAGIAAALLDDAAHRNAILQGQDTKAQLALLASARYLRLALPLDLVAALFREKTLAVAVENYLIVEDSAVARRLVWARYPGEALILGERFPRNVSRDYVPEYLAAFEEEARRIVKAGNRVEELVAFYSNDQDPKVEIRLREGRAQLRLFTDRNVWRERMLTNSELIELQTLLARPEVEDLKPETPLGGYQEGFYEFLRVNKDGGRRIVLEGLKPAPRSNATLHEQLSDVFYRLSKAGEYVVHYAIEAKLPGVEVLHAYDKQPILTVCQEGGETLVFVSERLSEPGSAKQGGTWRLFKDGQLGGAVNAPEIFRDLDLFSDKEMLNLVFRSDDVGALPIALIRQAMQQHKVTSLGELRAALVPGSYFFTLTTPGQKWHVGVKLDAKNGDRLVRFNQQTGQEFEVRVEGKQQSIQLMPLSYLAAQDKFLLASESFVYGSHYLLDPASGTLQPASGEFRPLRDQGVRPLQPTGKANEYWATIYELARKQARIGRYNAQTFTFTPVLDVPELELRCADVWVDEKQGKVWLVHRGHLLRLPLPPSNN
jgi:hypothetical protein